VYPTMAAHSAPPPSYAPAPVGGGQAFCGS
jgi:hypothetical protein